jgi:hypothetical protein
MPWMPDSNAILPRAPGSQRSHPRGLLLEPVHPVDNLLTVQVPRHPGIAMVCYLPTQSFRQASGHLILCLLHDPPPSAASEYPSAIEECGPPIKALACLCLGALASHDTYIGISVEA